MHHDVISQIEFGLDQIRSLCQQLEQAERTNQQIAQQLQSAETDPNVRTQLQSMAQKEGFNAQKLQQISQIASQARQEVNQLRQQVYAVQPQFQQPMVTGFQPVQPIAQQFQPAGFQQLPSGTQQWVQRHVQPGLTPSQALNILQQGVPQQLGTQSIQTVPHVQAISPISSVYNMNPYFHH